MALGLVMVFASFLFAAHAPLVAGKALFMALETIERRDEIAIAEGGETGNADINADQHLLPRNGRFNFFFCLNGHEPLATALADGGVLDRSNDFAAVAIAQPTQLGQEDAAVALIELDLLGVGIAEAVRLAFFLKRVEKRRVCRRSWCTRVLNPSAFAARDAQAHPPATRFPCYCAMW